MSGRDNDGLSFYEEEDTPMVRQGGNLGITGGPDRVSSTRPLRDKFESITDRIPTGPLDKVGEGDLVGLGGFVAVEATRPLIEFVPGLKQPGYKVNAHSTEKLPANIERHTVTIQAISEDVAEFVAGYTATPSNIDFLTTDIDLYNTEIVTERPTYTTFRITVDINERS